MTSRNRGKKKPKLRDLSRKQPTYEEKDALRKQVIEKFDAPIVTAILGVALVEAELDALLRVRFRRQDDDTWEALTGDRGPLATFSTKIIAAHAFGIIDDVIRDGLDTIRAIRNAFAHSKTPLTFQHELVAKELQGVTLPTKPHGRLYRNLKIVRDSPTGAAQGSYILLSIILEVQLVKIGARAIKAKSRRFRKKHPARWAIAQTLLGRARGFQPPPPQPSQAGHSGDQVSEVLQQFEKSFQAEADAESRKKDT